MGSYFDTDGLYRQYGPTKAVPTTAGDFLSYGEMRVIEVTIDLTTLTASPVIQANTTFVPANAFIEEVNVDTEVGATGGTSFSVGLVQNDRSTVVSNTQFVNALVIASTTTAGQKVVLNAGSTSAGAGIGTTNTNTGYITALAAGTYTAGKVKVRIKYRGFGTITQ